MMSNRAIGKNKKERLRIIADSIRRNSIHKIEIAKKIELAKIDSIRRVEKRSFFFRIYN